MKTFIIKSTIVAFISTFTFFANAGFHLEPNLGHTLAGGWEQGNDDGDLSMLNIGVKLGYQAPIGIQVGGDIQSGVGSLDSGSNDADIVYAAVGPYIGYMAPFGLKVSFSYYLASQLELDSFADPTYSGNGFRLGAGYSFKRQGLSWLAVNLDYTLITYDEVDSDFSSSQSLSNDIDTDTIILSVSFPFNF